MVASRPKAYPQCIPSTYMIPCVVECDNATIDWKSVDHCTGFTKRGPEYHFPKGEVIPDCEPGYDYDGQFVCKKDVGFVSESPECYRTRTLINRFLYQSTTVSQGTLSYTSYWFRGVLRSTLWPTLWYTKRSPFQHKEWFPFQPHAHVYHIYRQELKSCYCHSRSKGENYEYYCLFFCNSVYQCTA